jgi:hypothetical protein
MRFADGVFLVRGILEMVVDEQQSAIGGGIVGGAETEADINSDMEKYINALAWFDETILTLPSSRPALDRLPKRIQDKINEGRQRKQK